MIIDIPKEVKNNEYRVACHPMGAEELIKCGHKVIVETNAGLGSGFTDEEYKKRGAIIYSSPQQVFKEADLIYKVKEMFPSEFGYLREGQIIATYIHSNAFREQTDALLEKKVIGFSYEDVEDKDKEFPLLKHMSIIAGKGGFIAALNFCQKVHGGTGLLLTQMEGTRTPEITIIGAGNSGKAAAELAAAFGNKVTMLDINLAKLEEAKKTLPLNVEFLLSNRSNLEMCLKRTDVFINCILWPKFRKDHLVNLSDLGLMKKGALIVDVACDEGGAIESCRSTSHDDPIYEVSGVTHYCVDNIPSGFSQTASQALCNATLPYILEIANKGAEEAFRQNSYLRRGLSFYCGKLTLEETGRKQNRSYTTPEEVLGL